MRLASCFFLLAAVFCAAPANGQPALGPEGKTEFEQGVAAARAESWDVAIRHFEEAQKKAGFYMADLLFNLGVAHSRARHPIIAANFFRAYLAAKPGAENAETVRAEIARLMVQAETTVTSLINQARDAALALKLTNDFWPIAIRYGNLGDVQGALKINPSFEAELLGYQAGHLAKMADFSGARAVIGRIDTRDPVGRALAASAWAGLSTVLGKIGDFEGELFAIDQMLSDYRPQWLCGLASRDLDAVEQRLAKMDSVEIDRGSHNNNLCLERLVPAYLRRGNGEEALKVLRRFPKADGLYMAGASYDIARFFLAIGQTERARAVAQSFLAAPTASSDNRYTALLAIAGRLKEALSLVGEPGGVHAKYPSWLWHVLILMGRSDEALRLIESWAPSPALRQINVSAQVKYADAARITALSIVGRVEEAMTVAIAKAGELCHADITLLGMTWGLAPVPTAISAALRADRLDLADKLVESIPTQPGGKDDVMCTAARAAGLGRVADAYLAKRTRTDALSRLAEAAKLAVATSAVNSSELGKLIEPLAWTADALGENTARDVIRSLWQRQATGSWIELALQYDRKAELEFEKDLMEIKQLKPEAAPMKMADVADSLGRYLNASRYLEKQIAAAEAYRNANRDRLHKLDMAREQAERAAMLKRAAGGRRAAEKRGS